MTMTMLVQIGSLALWMIGSVADAESTEIALRLGARETNPVLRWFIGKFGLRRALEIDLLGSLVIGLLLYRVLWPLLLIGALVRGSAAFHNWRVAKIQAERMR